MPQEHLEMDAFSDGQIDSKLWLCNELERIALLKFQRPVNIWILGGWYGLLGFLLKSRQRLPISQIRSFDVCENAVAIANQVNKNWEIKEWQFRAFTQDANELEYKSGKFGPSPDIVTNTSCEHFDSLDWWKNISPGTLVALQSTDMPNHDHKYGVKNLDEMKSIYGGGFETILYQGSLFFRYPDWSFHRFMLIGIKK